MSFIRTASNSIRNDAETVKELTEAIPVLMKELEEGLTALNNCWEGAAWNQYQNTNAYYMDVLEDVHQYYVNFATSMMKASTEYMRAEQDVMDDIDSWFL